MKKILLLCTLMVLSACASKQLPLKGHLVSASSPIDMTVSSEVIKEYSDPNNLLIQINFESNDGRWVRVDSTDIDLSNKDDSPYNVIIGKDLLTWAEAKAEQKKMGDYNNSMKSVGWMAAGGAMAIVGALSQSDELAAAGILTYAGTGIYEGVRGLKATQKSVQGVKFVPDTHLLAPFTVPSRSLVKRWVLINTPDGRIAREMRLKLKTIDGETYVYTIPVTNTSI